VGAVAAILPTTPEGEIMKTYVLIMQNGEIMDGVSYSDFKSASAGLKEYGAEYIAQVDNDGDLVLL